jgi:hypothetical protein
VPRAGPTPGVSAVLDRKGAAAGSLIAAGGPAAPQDRSCDQPNTNQATLVPLVEDATLFSWILALPDEG